MSTIILYLTLIISSVEPQTNPYIGEWEIDWVEDLDNFCKVKEEDYQDFKSSIEFKSDFTWKSHKRLLFLYTKQVQVLRIKWKG